MTDTAIIAIIGGGNMGNSLLGGLIADGYPAVNIWVSDPSAPKLKQLKDQFHIHVTSNNQEAVKTADIVILAVKPQLLSIVTAELAPLLQHRKSLVISICAGVKEHSLQTWLGGEMAIVRAMPNTPALIGCGATALYANNHVTTRQRNTAESILRAVGLVIWIDDEKLMDVVTALSGSGPAYFFLVMECLQQAAEKLGLPTDIARSLTLQTALGAARMAMESDETIADLRQRVTSPGGTTEQALKVFEKSDLRKIFSTAVEAAEKRSAELAELVENTTNKQT